MESKPCETCGRTFTRPTGAKRIAPAQWAARKFCSQSCAGRRERPWARGDHTPKTCVACGKVFTRGRDGERQWAARRFCSHKCSRQGEHHPNWKGGRTVNSGGYIRVWTPNGLALEHRLVMAEQLGRPLTENETVHHKDGNRQNNDPGNLELRTGSHGRGATKHCPTCTCGGG